MGPWCLPSPWSPQSSLPAELPERRSPTYIFYIKTGEYFFIILISDDIPILTANSGDFRILCKHFKLSFAYQNARTNALDVLIHISFQESCDLSQETAGSVDLAYLMIQQNDAKTFD